jgi:hypothetical protein
MTEPFLRGFAELIYLCGDEDGGCGFGCRGCWDGGRPIAYIAFGGSPYNDPEVVNVNDFAAFVTEARKHIDEKHPEAP